LGNRTKNKKKKKEEKEEEKKKKKRKKKRKKTDQTALQRVVAANTVPGYSSCERRARQARLSGWSVKA
jgi:hypothetical protein